LRLPACFAALCLAAGLAQHLTAAPSVGLVIVPGKTIGPVGSGASLTDFTKAFGPANVRQGDVYLGEESEEPGLILFPRDAERRLHVGWKDSERKRGVRQIFIVAEQPSVRPTPGKWRLQNGIAIGTTLREMEKLNGRPFTLYFTDYDAGSGIASWNGGRLGDGFNQNWKVLVEAETSWALRIGEMRKARNSDQIRFESNSAVMQSSNPWVGSIYAYF